VIAKARNRRRPITAHGVAEGRLSWRYGVVGSALLLMAVYFTMPLAWLLFAFTKGNATLYSTPGFWFGPDLQIATNLHWLFTYQDNVFLRWMLNSLLYAGGIGLMSTLISSMAGFAFSQYNFPGNKVIFTIILGALMVPPAALVIPIFLFVKTLGLINTYAGVVFPLMASPFGVYFMREYMADAIPADILDAGRVDGASEYLLFRVMALRLVMPGLITLFLITFVGVWNNFFLPLVILSDPKLFPVTLGLAIWQSTANSPGTSQPLYPLVITGALFSILPLIVLFLYLQRYIVSGLTLGSYR